MASGARRVPPGPVAIVGSGISGVAAPAIADAFRALGSKDVVFGPATGGGYWLVGLCRFPRFVDPFETVRWSSECALADTLANLADKVVAMLRPLSDVDDGAAWRDDTRVRLPNDYHRP